MKVRYRTINQELKERFNQKVRKISINAGFTCPNRDGSKGTGGCIYCNNVGFNLYSRISIPGVEEQIQQGMDFMRKRFKAQKFIVYFQAYSNTYGPVEKLRELYFKALGFPDVVGISIGTRPDCISDEILDLLEELNQRTYLWVEYGLQSIHNKTLNRINRGHSSEDFFNAVKQSKMRNLRLCVHIILGLPGETKEDMLQTGYAISKSGVDGIKFHNLHIVKDTVLERIYKENGIRLMSMDEYVEVLAEIIELLPPEMVIHRLVADAPKDFLVAPEWALKKFEIIHKLNRLLEERNSFQGAKFNGIYASQNAPK